MHLSPDNLTPACQITFLIQPLKLKERERVREYLLSQSLIFIYFSIFFIEYCCFSEDRKQTIWSTENVDSVVKCPLEEVHAHTLVHTHAHTDTHIEELFIYSLPWWEQYSVPSVFCGPYTNGIHTVTHTHKCQALCIQSCNIQNLSHTHKCTITYPWNIIDLLLESFAKENSIFKSPMLSLQAWRKDNVGWNICDALAVYIVSSSIKRSLFTS